MLFSRSETPALGTSFYSSVEVEVTHPHVLHPMVFRLPLLCTCLVCWAVRFQLLSEHLCSIHCVLTSFLPVLLGARPCALILFSQGPYWRSLSPSVLRMRKLWHRETAQKSCPQRNIAFEMLHEGTNTCHPSASCWCGLVLLNLGSIQSSLFLVGSTIESQQRDIWV